MTTTSTQGTPRVDAVEFECRAWESHDQADAFEDLARQLEREMSRLRAAATALYEAAHWTADRPVDEIALWTELRDALGRDPGGAPKPLTDSGRARDAARGEGGCINQQREGADK